MPDDAERLLAVVDGTGRWYLMSLFGLVASGLVVAAAVVLGRWVRTRSPFLGTIAMVSAFVGGVLMASMAGFKLFLPTLARLAPVDGATAVGEFIGSASFAPMVGGFMLRLSDGSCSGWRQPSLASSRGGQPSSSGWAPSSRSSSRPAPTRGAGSSLPSASVSSPTGPSSTDPSRPEAPNRCGFAGPRLRTPWRRTQGRSRAVSRLTAGTLFPASTSGEWQHR